MTSKTQPPELIFVVLNFVALDDCTRHAPFAIERKRSGNRHQSDRNREISSLGSLILRLIVKDTVNKLKMPDIEPCVHGDFLPDDLYLLRQISVGCKFRDCYSSHENKYRLYHEVEVST